MGALTIVLDGSARLVSRVTAGQLPLGTPCPGWSVRDVIGHAIGVTLKFAVFARGTTDRPHAPSGDLVGDDHRTAFRNAATTAMAAWACADPGRICHLPFGSFPAEVAAGINLFDLLAHSWDIAVATDQTVEYPDEIWVAGLRVARQVIGDDRDPRHYGPELPAGPSPTAKSQLLSFLGRDPRRADPLG